MLTLCYFCLNTGGQTITAESENVLSTFSTFPLSYYKVMDPASWISVNKNTGELRVVNTIDRESKFVQDGMYNITMKAVDSSKLLVNVTGLLVTAISFWFCRCPPRCLVYA